MQKWGAGNVYVEDKNWATKNIPESIKSAMVELQVIHDQTQEKHNKYKVLSKIVPVHIFTNNDVENELKSRFKSEIVPVLLEQQFQDVNYYQGQRVGIDSSSVVGKYYRCSGGVDNPDLITGYKNGVPFRAGQVKIRTSTVENSQTGSSGTELAFAGLLIALQNKFSVEKPVTIALGPQKGGVIKSALKWFNDGNHSATELENEFYQKFRVITKNTNNSFLTHELMTKLIDIKSKANYIFTVFFEEDKIYITVRKYDYDLFGLAFYDKETLEKKFNNINETIQLMGDVMDWASILVE